MNEFKEQMIIKLKEEPELQIEEMPVYEDTFEVTTAQIVEEASKQQLLELPITSEVQSKEDEEENIYFSSF